MNTVLSSYGQLCGCPEILKKSCKFFCRGLDIRVPKRMIIEGEQQFFMDNARAVFKRVCGSELSVFGNADQFYTRQ